MRRPIALGASIGVPAGLWTVLALSVTSIGAWEAPLVVWIGFAAWATFHVAGGGCRGRPTPRSCSATSSRRA